MNRHGISARHRAATMAASRRRFMVWGVFGAAACFAPALTGCSGGTKHGPEDSTYAGSYRAAYTIPSVNENGTFSYSVAQKGDIIGSFVDSSTNVTRAFSGHIGNNGSFSGTTTEGSLSYPTSGTISKVVSSSTGGDFRQMRNGVSVPGSFSFVTTGVTPATDSPFVGAYSGSFNLTGQTAGPASYSIDKQGGVTGYVTTNGEVGALRGQVSNTGAFTGNVSYSSGQATLSGALATTATKGLPAGNFIQTKGSNTTPGTFGGAIPLPADSPFTGAYGGSFNLSGQGAGPASYSVDKQGGITGFVSNGTETGTFNGQVTGTGTFTGTVAYPSGQATIGGTLATTKDGTPAGNFTQTKGNTSTPGNFGGPIPLPADSPFVGAYSGSFNLTGQGTGPASYSVSKQGGITGYVSNGSETGLFSGQVTGAGTFIGTVAYPSGQATIGGTLATTANGQPAGNFTQTKGNVNTPGNFGGPIPLPADSPFTGAYSGSFSLPNQLAGPASYSVDKQGNLTGLVTSKTDAGNTEAGILRGQVSSSGAFTGTITYPSGQATIGGTLATTKDGTTSGNFTQTKGSTTVPGSFGGPTALPADSPWIGSYQGGYGVPDKNESGVLSLTVDTSGGLLGSFDKSNGTPLGVFSGSMISDGTFFGTITYPAASDLTQYPVRVIKGKMATKQGGTANTTDPTKLQADFLTDNGKSPSDGQPTPLLPGYFDTVRTNPKNGSNIFRGAYGNSSDIPAFSLAANGVIPTSSGMSITIDKEGTLLGRLGGLQVNGTITDDGRFIGVIFGNGAAYSVSGKFSKQGVPVALPVPPATLPTFSPGIAGNIVVTINGTDYPGVIQVAGGFTN